MHRGYAYKIGVTSGIENTALLLKLGLLTGELAVKELVLFLRLFFALVFLLFSIFILKNVKD